MLSLRSRAGDPAAQRWYSDCGDGTWRLRSLLQGTRVKYVTETFPFSRSLRVTSDDRRNWDPYQSATGAAPSSALCRPPDPSYKADDRTGLYTEKVNYCCSLSNPNSRTWITLGSVPSAWKGFRLHRPHTRFQEFIGWKGLAPDAPPRLDAGVLEDSTGFTWLRNSLEN